MTSVFHQEMFNYIQKPQYRLLTNPWEEVGVKVGEHAIVDVGMGNEIMPFDQDLCRYDNIIIAYGSETGTSLKYANIVAGYLGDNCIGPVPLDTAPALVSLHSGMDMPTLLLVLTSTFGKGCPPNGATSFISELKKQSPTNGNCDFSILALGNSAYDSFISFGIEVNDALKRAGYKPVLPLTIADELKNQDDAFSQWELSIYGDITSVVYTSDAEESIVDEPSVELAEMLQLTYTGTASLTKDATSVQKEITELIKGGVHSSMPYVSYSGTLIRSTDLFSFKAKDLKAKKGLDSVEPGDHIGECENCLDS